MIREYHQKSVAITVTVILYLEEISPVPVMMATLENDAAMVCQRVITYLGWLLLYNMG